MQAKELLQARSLRYEDTTLLHLTGELDLATAPLLDHAVAECLTDSPRQLCIDVASISFCDRSGLRALQRARNTALDHHATFCLSGAHHSVRKILVLLDATDLLQSAAPQSRPP